MILAANTNAFAGGCGDMAFVGKDHLHDVFVSYSHGPAEAPEPDLRAWSELFARRLETEIRLIPGLAEQFSLYIDTQDRPGGGIDPFSPLGKQLRMSAANSAILAVLMSPHYLASQWCRKEREWWFEGQANYCVPPADRLAPIRILPTTEADWPGEFGAGSEGANFGFTFHDDRELEFSRPLGWCDIQTGLSAAARKGLVDVAGHVSRKLRDFRRELEAAARRQEAANSLAGAQGQVLFLHGREEISELWHRTREELDGTGYIVLPSHPAKRASGIEAARQVAQERVEAICQCDAILVLGGEDSDRLDADLVQLGLRERQLARHYTDKLIPCALLDRVGPPVRNEVRTQYARRLQAQWLDATSQPWIPRLRSWLNSASAAAAG